MYIHIYVYTYTSSSSSSSSSCHTSSTDLPGPLSPPISIVYRCPGGLQPCIDTELLYLGSSRPCEVLHRSTSLTSPAVSCMSCLSNFDSFRDGW